MKRQQGREILTFFRSLFEQLDNKEHDDITQSNLPENCDMERDVSDLWFWRNSLHIIFCIVRHSYYRKWKVVHAVIDCQSVTHILDSRRENNNSQLAFRHFRT